MIDIYLLRYFLAVVETGSFTRAADRVFVTQPTLSAGIKKLEGQVGQILFERSNRRVFLTDAGTRFLPRAKAIMHECNLAMQSLEQTQSAPVLRVGVLTTLSEHEVGKLLSSFSAKVPDATLEIVDGTEQELLNRLDDRSLDYALSLYRGEKPKKAMALKKERYKFIVSHNHSVSEMGSVTAQDLRETYMIVRSRCEVLSETSRYFTDKNIRPRLAYRTPNDSKAIAMVAAGVGGTVVPESLIDETVTALNLTGFDYERRLALLFPYYELAAASAEVGKKFEEHVSSEWAAKE